jgi:hypothetical protein
MDLSYTYIGIDTIIIGGYVLLGFFISILFKINYLYIYIFHIILFIVLAITIAIQTRGKIENDRTGAVGNIGITFVTLIFVIWYTLINIVLASIYTLYITIRGNNKPTNNTNRNKYNII